MEIKFTAIQIEKPEPTNFILGQTHFINQVLIAETTQGRGILGVVDGLPPKGIEVESDIEWRKKFLRQIGYKL